MKWYVWLIIALAAVVLLFILGSLGLYLVFHTHNTSRANMPAEQMIKLSDGKLVEAIYFKILNKYESYSDDTEKLNAMNPSERTAYTVYWFDLEVLEGGICQYFYNFRYDDITYLTDALEAVGAKKMEACLSNFVAEHDIDVKGFRSLSDGDYQSISKLFPYAEFDDKYCNPVESENLEKLNAKFIREHIEDFYK